jgi:hypothetical protein
VLNPPIAAAAATRTRKGVARLALLTPERRVCQNMHENLSIVL